jgi:epoxyqueuosine reductase
VDANLCISYLTIENKDGIEANLRPSLGEWVFGCDICQEVCPYNQRPPLTPWLEFKPQSGVGHHLDLLSLLDIRDEREFRSRFAQTPLLRPKRRGLMRNALVVLGNALRKNGDLGNEQAVTKLSDWTENVISNLSRFALKEPDAMLREHAAWALTQSAACPKSVLQEMIANEENAQNRNQIKELLDRFAGRFR